MNDRHADLRSIFSAAVAAVEPRAAVLKYLRRDGTRLLLDDGQHDLGADGRVVVVGAGKASAAMAQAVEQLVGERIAHGVVVVKYGHGAALIHGAALSKVQLLEAGHPVPDAAGEIAARALEEALHGLTANDLVIACWSGGASALLPAPRAGITLADKQETTRLLLASGGDIAALNAVRKHLSRIKGGQLAQRALPASVWCLAISDVVGDDPATIGSGPFVGDPTTFAEVDAHIHRLGLRGSLPTSVTHLIADGVAGKIAETPKPGDPSLSHVRYRIIANQAQAITAAATAAQAAGYTPIIWREPLTGEARAAGATFACAALHERSNNQRVCLIAGGETTVTLGKNHGIGGRNQEFALAAAGVLGSSPWHGAPVPIAILSGGTDGNDGPTDAAGAIVDGTTMARAHAIGLDLEHHLNSHNAYPFFARLGDLLHSGPTGTNVMDIQIALVG
jgi:hydroxypyruvate reductase